MNKKDMALYCFATFIVVILNILMLTIFKSNDSETSLANVIVILFVLFMLSLVLKFGKYVDRRKVRPERAGIWGVAASSLIWFINRIDSTVISDTFNYCFLIAFIGMGIFFIFIAVGRNSKRMKSKDDGKNDDL